MRCFRQQALSLFITQSTLCSSLICKWIFWGAELSTLNKTLSLCQVCWQTFFFFFADVYIKINQQYLHMDRPQPDYLQMSGTDLLIPYWLLLPKLVCHQFLSSSSLMTKSVLPSKSWLSITDCRICNVQPLCKCCLLVWALPARIKKLEKRKIAQKTRVWNLPDKAFL